MTIAQTSAWSQATITQTRTSSFSYVASGVLQGVLQTETIEPDTANLCLVTTHSYDDYGNKAGASTANCAGASALALFDTRASSTTYAAQATTVVLSLGVNTTAVTVTAPAGTFATNSRVALTANIADTASHTESREYDPRFGAVTRLVGPNGVALATSWGVDEFGRKVLELRADGTSSKAVFCLIAGRVSDTSSNSPECGSLTFATNEVPLAAVRFEHTEPRNSVGNKMGPYSRAYFDAAGRKIRIATQAFDGASQPAGPGSVIVQDTTYNAHGAVVLATQPYYLASGSSTTSGNQDVGLSRTEYDALGRVTVTYTTDPFTLQQSGGGVISTAFGSWGNRRAAQTLITYAGLNTTLTNDKGRTRIEEKNPEGKVVRVTDALGAQTVHQHDALGNLITTKDPLGNAIVVTYDTRGRKTRLQDPDAGNTDYCYDALGQLKAQQTSNMRGGHGTTACPAISGAGEVAPTVSNWTTLAYDRLGRLKSRVEPEYTTTWYHDKDYSGNPCGASTGKTCETRTSHGVTRKTFYDTKGRAIAARTDVSAGPSMASALSYDTTTGRLQTQTYPTGLRISYTYTGLGYLQKVSNDTALTGAAPKAANTPLWEAQTFNAWGKLEKQLYGNNVQSRASYEPQSGRLHSLTAGLGSSNSIVHQRLHWDSLGQLSTRIDGVAAGGTNPIEISDSYSHDELGRLTQYVVAGSGTPSQRTVQLQYNALGMLLYKTDVGVYSYPAQGVSNGKPHAVQSVAGSQSGQHNASYTYDQNGNLQTATGGKYRSIAYTSFNLPDANQGLQGPAGSPKYTWQYDENHARIKETRVNTTGTRTTWYLHPDNQGGLGFERDEPAAAGTAQNRHYIGGYAMIVTEGALPTLTASQPAPNDLSQIAAAKVEYWHKDHLGSLIATTNAAGAATANYSYDPYGKRRQVNGSYDAFGALVVDFAAGNTAGTDRGYTGHEHLDDVGVIHMNGRIFDPLIGRFMQADPLIQDAFNLQNFDRYGYCYNNPTTCTDPSGFSFWTKFRDSFIRAVAAVADYYGCSGYCSAAVGAYQGGRNGGGFKGAVTGAAVAYAGYYVGTQTDSAAIQGFVSAAGACLNAEAGGGSCRQAAITSVANSLGGQYGIWGSLAAGCAVGKYYQNSCKEGASDSAASYVGSRAGTWFAEETRTYVNHIKFGPKIEVAANGKFNPITERWDSCRCFDLALALQRAATAAADQARAIWNSYQIISSALTTIIFNEGANSADKPAGVPDNWREEPTKGDGGRQWVNPDNPGDRVRVMPGNPDSPNPGQREPYVRDVRNGNQWLDVNGNRIEGKTGRNSPDTHVPAKDYVFRP